MLEKEEVLECPSSWPSCVPEGSVAFGGSVPIARNKSHPLLWSSAVLLRTVNEFPRHPVHFPVNPWWQPLPNEETVSHHNFRDHLRNFLANPLNVPVGSLASQWYPLLSPLEASRGAPFAFQQVALYLPASVGSHWLWTPQDSQLLHHPVGSNHRLANKAWIPALKRILPSQACSFLGYLPSVPEYP